MHILRPAGDAARVSRASDGVEGPHSGRGHTRGVHGEPTPSESATHEIGGRTRWPRMAQK
jgi:hypothetical protein